MARARRLVPTKTLSPRKRPIRRPSPGPNLRPPRRRIGRRPGHRARGGRRAPATRPERGGLLQLLATCFSDNALRDTPAEIPKTTNPVDARALSTRYDRYDTVVRTPLRGGRRRTPPPRPALASTHTLLTLEEDGRKNRTKTTSRRTGRRSAVRSEAPLGRGAAALRRLPPGLAGFVPSGPSRVASRMAARRSWSCRCLGRRTRRALGVALRSVSVRGGLRVRRRDGDVDDARDDRRARD